MMAEPSFLLRNNYAEPMDEGMAEVIALMLYRPEVNSKLFALTPEQASIVGETYRLKALLTVRSTIADSLSEFEAYADPDQDPSEVYNRIHAGYLGVDMHDTPVWAFNPMYGSDPIYLQSFVVGEMVAHQIQHDLLIVGILVENIRRIATRFRLFKSESGELLVYAKPYFALDSGQRGLAIRVPAQRGFQPEIVEHGRTQVQGNILHLLKNALFDVIVLDWMLPGRDGLQILRSLRESGMRRAS